MHRSDRRPVGRREKQRNAIRSAYAHRNGFGGDKSVRFDATHLLRPVPRAYFHDVAAMHLAHLEHGEGELECFRYEALAVNFHRRRVVAYNRSQIQ